MSDSTKTFQKSTDQKSTKNEYNTKPYPWDLLAMPTVSKFIWEFTEE